MRTAIALLIVMLACAGTASAQKYGELERATISVAAEVGDAVVSISSTVKQRGGAFSFGSPFGEMEDDMFRRFFEEFFGEVPQQERRRMGLGSGVIIDEAGYILTNEHVISGASEIKVKLSDGREFNAEVSGADPRSDLAVIRIDARDLPVARLGDSDALEIGRWVVAVGNPFGFAIENPEPTVTVGVVSAIHRYLPVVGHRERSYDDLIQTDAAINPGNSGGPLVNLDGEVIGINTAIITTTGGYQGLGFAIPINKAKRVLDKLIRGEKVVYGWLGVTIQDLNDDLRSYFGIKEQEGVIVIKVAKNSPADKSGFKEGDLILSFAGTPVKTTRDLVRMVSRQEVGQEVPATILRSGKRKKITVTIGSRPEDGPPVAKGTVHTLKFRGMKLQPLTPLLQRRYDLADPSGVVVSYIEDASPSDKAGLREGDLIVKIEGHQIESFADAQAAVGKVKGKVLVKTNRGYFVVREEK
ncbi:MAG: Do family serine endopeptidase [Candidatus Omnitrophica bacterium]|nr:Do family serine endopeptidase [Candidatus Omnitrophota bacterium]